MAPRLLLFAALLLLLGAGCTTMTRTGALEIAEPVPKEASHAWEHVVREHTRQVEVYFWAVREVDLRATLVTPRLRTAFIAAQERLHGRAAHAFAADLLRLGAPPDEGVDAPMLSRPTAEEEVIVYLAFYARDRANRDLAAGYSIWDVELVRGNARVRPLSMRQEAFSPALRALLPHIDTFDDVYVARFPLVDAATGTPMLAGDGAPLRLEVKSAIGYAIVEWSPVAR
jgi:hypothetical protein